MVLRRLLSVVVVAGGVLVSPIGMRAALADDPRCQEIAKHIQVLQDEIKFQQEQTKDAVDQAMSDLNSAKAQQSTDQAALDAAQKALDKDFAQSGQIDPSLIADRDAAKAAVATDQVNVKTAQQKLNSIQALENLAKQQLKENQKKFKQLGCHQSSSSSSPSSP